VVLVVGELSLLDVLWCRVFVCLGFVVVFCELVGVSELLRKGLGKFDCRVVVFFV